MLPLRWGCLLGTSAEAVIMGPRRDMHQTTRLCKFPYWILVLTLTWAKPRASTKKVTYYSRCRIVAVIFLDYMNAPSVLCADEYIQGAGDDISNCPRDELFSKTGGPKKHYTDLKYKTHVVRPTWKSGTISPNSLPTFRTHSRRGFKRCIAR